MREAMLSITNYERQTLHRPYANETRHTIGDLASSFPFVYRNKSGFFVQLPAVTFIVDNEYCGEDYN